MAPIDFEKELKDKLHSRELEPSEQAWERISARLEGSRPSKRRGPGLWIGLAAASIALLAGYLWMWDARVEPSPDPVVGTPEVEAPPDPFASPPVPFQEIPSGKGDNPVADLESPPGRKEAGVESAPGMAVRQPSRERAEPAVASVGSGQQNGVSPGTADLAGEIALPEASAGAPGQQEAEGIRDREVDLLLMRAREAIALQDRRDTLSGVDPMALLDRAEDELDQTFRDQILEKLKTGISKVRTAVADRNK